MQRITDHGCKVPFGTSLRQPLYLSIMTKPGQKVIRALHPDTFCKRIPYRHGSKNLRMKSHHYVCLNGIYKIAPSVGIPMWNGRNFIRPHPEKCYKPSLDTESEPLFTPGISLLIDQPIPNGQS